MPTPNQVPSVPEVPHARTTKGAPNLLTRLRYEGLHLDVRGQSLIVSPAELLTDELRTLIRDRKAQIIAALHGQQPVDMTKLFKAAMQTGHLVLCRTCIHFSARPAREPDGWCVKHGETWGAVPFECNDHEGSPTDDNI